MHHKIKNRKILIAMVVVFTCLTLPLASQAHPGHGYHPSSILMLQYGMFRPHPLYKHKRGHYPKVKRHHGKQKRSQHRPLVRSRHHEGYRRPQTRIIKKHFH